VSDNTMNQTLGPEDAAKQKDQPANAEGTAKPSVKIDLRPTLFIGVGGTGMEVLLRVRRRILNTLWGQAGAGTRVESLAEFPVAQFIQFDLDNGAILERGRAQAEDPQFDLVKFSDGDKVVETLDLDKYSRDDDTLDKFPLIKAWLPLTPQKIRALRIDPGRGAGQIRAVSRLYFFDKYAKIRDLVRQKLKDLQAGLSHEQQLSRLGLKMESGRFRIVVVGSVAGGTGSGAFIDMGLLVRWLAKAAVGKADVELMLFLPTGYAMANKDRTEANAYAALMELESAMRGNDGYVGRWDDHEEPELPRAPYNEVYLIDTGNLAQQHTKEVNDVYHMVADALFEDFASGDFAREKRSVAVNQAQHKNALLDALVPQSRFPDMRLSYSKQYSAMGLAVLDTLQEAHRDEQAHRWAGDMLKAFFGVGGADPKTNRANDTQRDDFMASHLALGGSVFSEFPEFSDETIKSKLCASSISEFKVVEDLLQDQQGSLLAGVEQRVNGRIDKIRNEFDRKEWPKQVREAIVQLERDAVRDQDSTADTTEDRVAKRRHVWLEEIKPKLRNQLYAYLDNKEFGGLEYVLSLVEQTKDRLEAPKSGVIATLKGNAQRYRDIKEKVRNSETEYLLGNLAQTEKRGWFNDHDTQADTVMDQLRTELANGIKFHLRAKAADEAAALMADVSAWLGCKTGVDAQGRANWSNLVGEFQKGREAVLDMLGQLSRANAILQKELKQDHATLIHVPAPQRDVPMPGASQLREWADQAFKDLGGSKVLFPMLAEPKGRSEILTKVKRMAERQLAQAATAKGEQAATQATDPLVDALEQMKPAARQEVFRKLLACAMPWIDANLSGDFTVNADQYKCFIGVSGADEFKRRYGHELDACVPITAGISAKQLSVVETGVPGRAVCYTELSGVPLTILRGIEGWRTSYRKESDPKKNPTHTHINSTQFHHPIAPSTGEINRVAEDFKYFLLAVMTGVLTRYTQRIVPAGHYQFAAAPGDIRRIGNERAFRQNGLPQEYREKIVNRVQDLLAKLERHQLAALSALSEYYELEVYSPKLVDDETGAQHSRKGFASCIAAEVKQELRDKALRKGLSKEQLDEAVDYFLKNLNKWAKPIEASDQDAYDWEVQPHEDGLPRLKYLIEPKMLQPGALESLLNPAATAQTHAVSSMPGASAPAYNQMLPPTLGVMPPLVAPPPLVGHQYFLGINGVQYGPFAAQQLLQMVTAGLVAVPGTKVWRQGLPAWVELGQLDELGSLAPAAPMPPPLG